jgi:hypothetical protein
LGKLTFKGKGICSLAFATFATLRSCKSLNGALRSHSSKLIVCLTWAGIPLGKITAALEGACVFEEEIDKEEGACPRRLELGFPLKLDALLFITTDESY